MTWFIKLAASVPRQISSKTLERLIFQNGGFDHSGHCSVFPPAWIENSVKTRTYYSGKPAFTQTRNLGDTATEMPWFVIGVSGATCGGKTSFTKLLQRSFPWAKLVHQDHYFHDDDWPHHIRVPEAENHVNYEIFQALDMERMYKDVQALLEGPPKFMKPTSTKNDACSSGGAPGEVGDKAETPNYDEEFLKQIPDITKDMDLRRYSTVPILIIEGFTIFGSPFLFEKCHVRVFFSLDKETCRERRARRSYFPPDTPSYFDKVIYPEYKTHFDSFIDKRPTVTVFDGTKPIDTSWWTSLQIITCRVEEQLGNKLEGKREKELSFV